MQHLAMLISDTLVIDAGVFDHDSRQGMNLMSQWSSRKTIGEPFDEFMLESFTYEKFLKEINDLWIVEKEDLTPWTNDGRRNITLKRVLPPRIQIEELEYKKPMIKPGKDTISVFQTNLGYFKIDNTKWRMLAYDVYSKQFKKDGLVTHMVFDKDEYVGFIMEDFGDVIPDPLNHRISEELILSLIEWLLPMGLVPLDVARENIRIHQNDIVWIDIEICGVAELTAFVALWLVSNIYRQYPRIPGYILRSNDRPNMMRHWQALSGSELAPSGALVVEETE
jgi:hypothetical protein